MKTVQMNCRVPPAVREWIKQEAAKDDREPGYFLSKLIEPLMKKKEIKGGAEMCGEIDKLLGYLNEVSGRQFKTSNDLAARLKDGYTAKDIARVIKYKCQEWMGTQSQKYIRPSTLFNKTKFEGYINDANQGVPNEKSGTTNQPGSGQSRKLGAGDKIRAAIAERDRQAMGDDGGHVRPQMDEQLRGCSGPTGDMESIIEGDFVRTS